MCLHEFRDSLRRAYLNKRAHTAQTTPLITELVNRLDLAGPVMLEVMIILIRESIEGNDSRREPSVYRSQKVPLH